MIKVFKGIRLRVFRMTRYGILFLKYKDHVNGYSEKSMRNMQTNEKFQEEDRNYKKGPNRSGKVAVTKIKVILMHLSEDWKKQGK